MTGLSMCVYGEALDSVTFPVEKIVCEGSLFAYVSHHPSSYFIVKSISLKKVLIFWYSVHHLTILWIICVSQWRWCKWNLNFFYSFSTNCWVFFLGGGGSGKFQGKVSCSSDVLCFSGYFWYEILLLAKIFFTLVSHKPNMASSTLFSLQYMLDFIWSAAECWCYISQFKLNVLI
jgi:hypothetical protein